MSIMIRVMVLTLVSAGISYGQTGWLAGHGDVGIGYEDGELEPHWHLGEDNESVRLGPTVQSFGPDGTEFEPDELIAKTGRIEARDADALWDFTGVAAGADLYVFPEVEDPTAPYVGIGTEELTVSDWSTDITLTLTSISGSGVDAGGEFSLYTIDTFSGDPVEIMSTNDGISSADAVSQAAGTHEHYNWAFTQLGRYDLTFEVTGTHATNGAEMATATYSFEAIPEPGTAALLLLPAFGWLVRRKR